MDTVLSEQPPDTWNSYLHPNFPNHNRPRPFVMMVILNKCLQKDDNLKNGKFHQHLRETFAPQVVRYVDLMESSIGQSIHKGFEKERWEIKGNGCATSEDLFGNWMLYSLLSETFTGLTPNLLSI